MCRKEFSSQNQFSPSGWAFAFRNRRKVQICYVLATSVNGLHSVPPYLCHFISKMVTTELSVIFFDGNPSSNGVYCFFPEVLSHYSPEDSTFFIKNSISDPPPWFGLLSCVAPGKCRSRSFSDFGLISRPHRHRTTRMRSKLVASTNTESIL